MARTGSVARLGRRCALATVAVALIAGSAAAAQAAPADRASASRWRIVATFGPVKGYSILGDVSATGPASAWATGVLCDVTCKAQGENSPAPLLEHWNGRSWSRVAAPKGATFPGGPSAIRGGVWLTAQIRGHTDTLRWFGDRWLNIGVPPCRPFYQLTAFGPNDVWAFGPARCAAVYTGHGWHLTTRPLPGGTVSPVSASDIWVFDVNLRTRTNSRGSAEFMTAEHWNGRGWQRGADIAMPTAPPHPKGTFEGAGVTAFSPRNMWVTYSWGTTMGCCGASRVLEHWNGRRWQKTTIPFPVSTMSDLVADGGDGIWVEIGAAPLRTYLRLDHFGAGHWSQTFVPAPAGQSPSTLTLAWAPGSRSVWGVASIGPNSDPFGYAQAVIYKYGS